MKTKQLLVNKIRTPDGTMLQSFNRHDFRMHLDSISNEKYIVDGGIEYARRSINLTPYEDLSIYSDDTHELIREGFLWGTYGPKGDQPLKRVAIKDLTTDHINAILLTQSQLPDFIRKVFTDELCFRKDTNV